MSLDLWIQEAVAILRINRPHQRNAFSREMWRELKNACEEVGDNSQCRQKCQISDPENHRHFQNCRFPT